MSGDEDWMKKGCAGCRQAVLTTMGLPLLKLECSALHHCTLYRCELCSSLWIETEREAHVADQNEVETTFPGRVSNWRQL